MLAYNTFDNLQDSSLGVAFGFADIQGNTFEKLIGKPFVDFRPMVEVIKVLKQFEMIKYDLRQFEMI